LDVEFAGRIRRLHGAEARFLLGKTFRGAEAPLFHGAAGVPEKVQAPGVVKSPGGSKVKKGRLAATL